LSAQTSDKLLATELIAMLKSLKDVYAEAGRTRINDVLDAIEATAKLKRTSLVEHTSQ
jgi:hypothetical protein